MTSYRWPVSASFFGMVLGIVGLGNCWRSAPELWQLPALIGELIMFIGAIV